MNKCEFAITEVGIGQRFLVQSPRGETVVRVMQISPKVVLERINSKGKNRGREIKVPYERFVRDGSDRKGRLRFVPLDPPPPIELTYGDLPEMEPTDTNILRIALVKRG